MNKIVHCYLTNFLDQEYNVIKGCGFADFLRGTIALYQYAKQYNYKLYINKYFNNKLFKYLSHHDDIYINEPVKQNQIFIHLMNVKKFGIYDASVNTSKEINKAINFSSIINKNYYVHTNSCYKYNNQISDMWPIIDDPDCLSFMQKFVTLNEELDSKVNFLLERVYKTSYYNYNILHLRCGDEFLLNNKNPNNYKIKNLLAKIEPLLTDSKEYILLTDSIKIAKTMLKIYPKQIKYCNNKKTHLGLDNTDDQSIKNSLIDYFTMKNAKEIYAFSVYHHGTGFSESVSRIFNIPYKKVLL